MEATKQKPIVEMFDVSQHKNWLVGGNHSGVNPSPGVVAPSVKIRI